MALSSEFMNGKIAIKRILAALMSTCGIDDLLEHFCLSTKAFVLMYHRVLSTVDNQPCLVQPGMFVSASTFEKHLSFLKARFKVVFLEDLVNMILTGENIGGVCSITFDDGWQDNYTDAFPVLEKYQVPATVFLASGYVGTDRIFWPEEIAYYLAQRKVIKSELDSAPRSAIRFFEEIGKPYQNRRVTFFDRGIEILKRYSPNEREEILGYFRGMFGSNSLPRQMLSWEEAREMQISGLVRFGAHTASHEILDQVSLEKARDEISTSRKDIEHRLETKVRTFAYPNGNYNTNIQAILQENKFVAAVTTRKGFLKVDTPLMEIPRIGIHEDISNTIPMFQGRILLEKF
jgi:peptidoglycan/xylan/chitin deacetylase (PgdA/CDA1 family)